MADPAPIAQAAPPDDRAPLALARLVQVIEQEPRARDEAHARIVSIVRNLADVLAGMPGASVGRIERIRTLASDLETSEPAGAGPLRKALDEVLATLAMVVADDDDVARSELSEAKTAVARVSPDGPVLAQPDTTRVAFSAIADTMIALYGAERASLPDIALEIRRDPQLFSERTEQLSVQVTLLASSTGWSSAQRISADVLDLLALAVASAPTRTMSIDEQTVRAQRIRLEAHRLRRASTLSFRRLDWMQQGLEVALATLETLIEPGAPAHALVVDARAAVAAIDTTRSFEFQRAAVQNAVRVVTDALRVHATRVASR